MTGRRLKKSRSAIAAVATLSIPVLFFYVAQISVIEEAARGSGLAQVVGVSALIAPNSYNTLALQLEKKQEDINFREQSVAERERQVSDALEGELRTQKNIALGALALALMVFILLVFNYYFDYRSRNPK